MKAAASSRHTNRMLKEQAPDLPVSQTQIYRYFHGEAPPRLDVVYELARLFGAIVGLVLIALFGQ